MKPFKAIFGKKPVTLMYQGVSFDTNTGNKAVAFAAQAGDLIIAVTAESAVISSTVTDDQGGTYTTVASCWRNSSNDGMQIHVRNALVPTSGNYITTVAFPPTDTGGGIGIIIAKGMTQAGSAAIRSAGVQNFQAGTLTPAPVLDQAPLAKNPIIASFFTGIIGTITPRTGYTEHWDATHSTPAAEFQCMSIEKGEISATITYGGPAGAGSTWAACAVELNT